MYVYGLVACQYMSFSWVVINLVINNVISDTQYFLTIYAVHQQREVKAI